MSGTASSLGYYYVDKVVYDGVKYTITAYDCTPEMDELYDVTNGLTNSQAIVSAIATATGMTMNSNALPAPNFPIKTVPEGTTNRQMLGYIYGCEGNNLRVNVSDGEIHRYWYSTTTARNIPRTAQYQNRLLQQLTKVTISSLRTGTQDNVIEMGSGFGIEYWNPYMTANMASFIFSRIYGKEYYVGEVKYRGTPAYQAGNQATVELEDGTSATMYIMAQTYNCDGGMNAVINSYGNEQATAVIRGGNVDQKIQKAYTGFLDALAEATEFLHGGQNGYYSVLQDENGQYIGWQITDTPGEPTATTKGWRWTYNGLQWSEDGFQTVSSAAITSEGHILGEYITGRYITFDNLMSSNDPQNPDLFESVDSLMKTEGNTNQWFHFDQVKGLLIGNSKDAEKKTVASMAGDGFRVLSADQTKVLLSAIATSDSESQVEATNLVAKNYLILQYENYTGRFEPYSGDTYDTNQIGFYFI